MSSDPDYSPTTLRPSGGEAMNTEAYQPGRETTGDQVDEAHDRAGETMDEARDRASEKMDEARDRMGETREKAMEQADRGRERAAEGAASAAERIRERSEGKGGVQEKIGTSVAGGMERTASYLRDHNTEDMFGDIERLAREHPLQALGGAVAAGFLLGRILR